MVVRTATKEDADILYEIMCRYKQKELPRDIFDGILKSNLKNSHRRLALAIQDNVAVGFADIEVKLTLATCTMTAVINDLFVDEKYRGKKIGTGMLFSLTSQMKTLGCDIVEIACSRVDIKAHEFLENNGYVKARHLFRHIIRQEDE